MNDVTESLDSVSGEVCIFDIQSQSNLSEM